MTTLYNPEYLEMCWLNLGRWHMEAVAGWAKGVKEVPEAEMALAAGVVAVEVATRKAHTRRTLSDKPGLLDI